MIVGYISDPNLRAAVAAAARGDEDAVLDPWLADEALAFAYPRLVVTTPTDDGEAAVRLSGSGVPVVVLHRDTLDRWEAERRSGGGLAPARVPWIAQQLRALVEWNARGPIWVDRTLAELGRAAGMPLPEGLRGVARRVLEFPSHYDDLHPLADACGTTRGALKGRFRRRGIPSPSAYLRWFRIMAVAHALSDREATVAQVASRLGYTSDGNLCRSMRSLTGFTPSEVRTLRGWNSLLIRFAWLYLRRESVEGWREMGDIFSGTRVA